MAFVNHQFNLLLFISHIALNLMLIEVNIKKNVLCDIPFHLLIFMETISIAFISYFSIFGSGLLTRTSIFSPIISSATASFPNTANPFGRCPSVSPCSSSLGSYIISVIVLGLLRRHADKHHHHHHKQPRHHHQQQQPRQRM